MIQCFYVNVKEGVEIMEGFLSDSILKQRYKLETEGQILFVQKWRELFHHKTINTYQVKLRNTHYILEEILMVIEFIKKGAITSANLKDLLLEAKRIVEKDICLRKNFLELQRTLNGSFKKVKDEQQKSDLLKLEYRIKYVLKTIENKYLGCLIEDLKESINQNNLEEIQELSKYLGSELINKGWASRSLYRLINIVFFNQSEFDDKWDNFTNHLNSEKVEFICYFKITDDKTELELENAELKIRNGQEILDTYTDLKREDFDLSAKYIEEKSFAYKEDSHTAVTQCLNNLLEKIAIFNYYEINFEKFNHTRVVFPNKRKSISYDLQSKQLENNKIDKEDIIKAQNIFRSEKVEKSSKIYLKNFFRQYNLSLDSLSIETKYTSLWTAIESLLVTGHHPSKIEHIKKIIPSILSSQYIIRLLKNYLYDCYRTRYTLKKEETIVNTESPTLEDLKMLFEILKDDNLSQNLVADIDNYLLLKKRTEELMYMLKNSETLRDVLTNHYNTTTYHIQRMYRIRNNLVHAAISEKDTSLIIDHLNFYVHATVNEIVEYLSSEEISNLGELFMLIEDNYYAIIAVLEENIRNSAKGNIEDYNNELIFQGALYI